MPCGLIRGTHKDQIVMTAVFHSPKAEDTGGCQGGSAAYVQHWSMKLDHPGGFNLFVTSAGITSAPEAGDLFTYG
jgi:hypothetical protein